MNKLKSYLTKVKEFYSLPFYVDKDVLIPRPETEQLVDLTFKEIKKRVKSGEYRELRIIDVGTGCGNIGITLIHKVLEKRLNKKYTCQSPIAKIPNFFPWRVDLPARQDTSLFH